MTAVENRSIFSLECPSTREVSKILLLNLDEKSRIPQYQQIMDQIRQKIEDRTINPGEKLPSTRKLADSLSIHRSTVASAYQELWALGFVDISPGSCPRVRERMEIATAANKTRKGIIDWNEIASPASTNIWREYLDFDTAQPRLTAPIISILAASTSTAGSFRLTVSGLV